MSGPAAPAGDGEMSASAGGEGIDQAERGPELAAVSRAFVKIHKDYVGVGPERSRADLSGDVLMVLLEGGYLRGEQTLQERGHADTVVDSRAAMQEALEGEYTRAVEEILGRRVRSFMSAVDPEQGLQIEILVLHPEERAAAAEQGGAPDR